MSQPSRPDAAVAIVGMGCRFPGGADSPDAYWSLLRDGVDAVGEFPPDRFDVDALFDPDPAAPGKSYSRWGGFLERIDGFDADFFGVSPREARRMDPQQRLLLEVCYEAFEDGAQSVDALAGGSVGVFVGISTHDYLDVQGLNQHRERAEAHLNTGTSACIAANRISYLWDLHGPSLSVDTACSSSLTAVHLACRSLAAGECDVAVASGVGVLLAPEVTIAFCKASMLSPRGRCHTFDAGADGFVRGEGCGAVVLKPLERALADGDPIHAVIRGSAINQDGRTTGLTVPSAASQQAMIEQAHRDAGVEPAQVQYVEAHGTGTRVGDPIEAEALGRALAPGRADDAPCVIGSAKTNLGHLEAAAGIAGLIKAVLALKHRQVPPNLHYCEPNPAIPFEELRLRVPTRLEPWPASSGPVLAGVNSFGFGGANAHVVLEAAPDRSAPSEGPTERGTHLLTLSARSAEALRALARRHRLALDGDANGGLHDHAFTAAVRRMHHTERLAVVAASRDEARAQLDAYLNDGVADGVAVGRAPKGGAPKLAFVFPGMGPQWWAMGRQLLHDEPAFRQALGEVDEILRPLAGWSLLGELARDEATSRVRDADVAHVANLGVQLGLAALWRAWGVVPDAVVGHSSGEMAAACVAGALTVPQAVRLAFHRGRLQHRTTGRGRMLAVAITPDEAAELVAGLETEVSLAAINAPSSVTLSGSGAALERIEATLTERQRLVRFLPVEVPYHGPQMEVIREAFLDAARDLRPGPTRIPLVSEVTGDWIEGTTLDADYWWRNVREPVAFAAAGERLLDAGVDAFVEVGPHPVLAAPLAEILAEHGSPGVVLPSLRRHADDGRVMLGTLAELHVRGTPVHWRGVYPTGTCTALPAYPWQRERYWFDDDDPGAAPTVRSGGIATGHPLLGRRLPAPHPIWETDLGDRALAYLDAHGIHGATVFPGAGYVEMALAAGRELWGNAPLRLEDVWFRQLLFPGSPRRGVAQLHYQDREGAVEIHAHPGEENEPWTLHATARLTRGDESGTDAPVDLPTARAQCHEPYAVEAHYAFFEERGYHYGLTFRTLREIWRGPDAALARLARADGEEAGRDPHRVHPALLDGVLQLFGAVDARSADEDGAGGFLPVSVRRLVLRHDPGARFWAYVRVRQPAEASVEDLEGDAWLFDEDGALAMALEGLRMRVLDEGVREEASPVDDWLYELRWEEAPREPVKAAAVRLRSAPEVAAELEARLGPPEEEPDLRRYIDGVEPQVERIADGYTLAALEGLGWAPEVALGEPAERAAEALGVAHRHSRLFAALASRARTLSQMGSGAYLDPPRDDDTLRGLLDALIEAEPQHAPELELMRRGGRNLGGILRGDVDAREVMLDEEALGLLQRFYTASPACRHHHARLADAIGAAVAHTGGAAPLRVLEVGAGTGAATEAVLSRLPEGSILTFTDISPYFVDEARARFGDRVDLRFATLDLERDPVPQGFDPGAYDVVFAANVLHATQDLDATLGHVRRLLADHGLLAFMELTRRAHWKNLVFGVLDGWWRYTDAHRHADGPMLDAGAWHALLAANGFEGATGLYGLTPEARRVETVQLAHAPAVASPDGTPRHWLVYTDGGGVTAAAAARLRRRGDRCTEVRPGTAFRRRPDGVVELPPEDEEACARMLEEAGARDGLHGVVHAWSLRAPAEDALDGDALMDAQAFGSGSVRTLVRSLDAVGLALPELWLVTAGAQAVDGHDAAAHVAQSALWGLGRSLMSEDDGPRCRLVDLAPDPAPGEAEALAAELEADDVEDELALRGPTRFARRLRRTSLAERPKAPRMRRAAPDEDAFRLELGTPGAIESVLLRELPDSRPGPGEMLVRVRASGLNFRDVLQALDMLPAATYAFDRDPGGIGSECAGVVVACGEGVERFRPGDEVITFATAAHASHVLAREALSVAKPAGVSFVGAAAVLAGFVTAEYALHHVARVVPGERVLIHAATGGVGLAALQLCRQVGAEVFATAGTPEKRAHLHDLGVELVMDSRSLAFADEVLRHTDGEGVDVILNSLSGEATVKGLSLLRPYGRFVELGKRDIAEDTHVGLAPFQRNRSYHAVDLVPMTVERPEFLRGLMADLAARIGAGALTVIPTTTFDLGHAEQALRFMAQAKHIGKVVLVSERPDYAVEARDEAPTADANGTYLITGGLGGLGLSVAQRLARQGAGALVLMSRSGMPPDGPEALAALRASASEVRVVRGDVSEEGDVRRVLDEIRRELPPLKGVVHAAMVLDDDRLVHLDRERFERVLRPKMVGAWHLHRLTRDLELDHFVLFSSVAAVLGHAMQGSYAAANAFLDALAAHRHAQGLPAVTVAWGALADVGYVARHDQVAEFLDRYGFLDITPDQALAAYEGLLHRAGGHVVVASMDWRRWAAMNPERAASPRFRHLVDREAAAPAAASDDGADAPLARLRATRADERPAVIEARVRHKAARILGATPEKVDPQRSLTQLGFDSLMAVELVTAIRADFDVHVPVVAILQDATVPQLAERILDDLDLGPGDPDASGARPQAADMRAPQLEDRLPLSFEQRRFWYLDRIDPGVPAYHVSVAARLRGRLDADALERSLTEVLARHETLRAAIHDDDGVPTQRFGPPRRVPMPPVDLSDVPAPEREAELQRRATEAIREPFDLGRGPLLRAVLFRLAAEEHVVLLIVHHIVSDAWAVNVMVHEIAALYDAFSRGEPSPLSPPPARYAAHVEHQAGRDRAAVEASLGYWTRRLADAPAALRLPAARRPHAAPARGRGGHVGFELTADATAALRAFGRRAGTTLFATLLAAFQTLLHRHSGEEDLCVGTAVSTRTRAGDEAVVGCYLNTLALRTDVSGDPTFRELLERARRTTLEAFEHQEVPFDEVVRALGPERGPDGTPLFQAMLVLHNARVPPLRLSGLELTQVDVESGAAVTELALLVDDGERLRGTLEYDVDRFDVATVEVMARQLRTLLEAIPTHAERTLAELPLETDAERRAVATRGREPAMDLGPPRCLHALVEAQVDRTPHAVAVEGDGERLTYADLDRRANRLAHRLRALGVGPDRPVGVCLPRSPEAVVAALGVLKAGGAYLPLEVAHPTARLRAVLSEADAKAVVTGAGGVDGFAETGIHVVPVDGSGEASDVGREERPEATGTPEDLAYVLYTSGSTGRPKGVLVPHRAIVNQVRWRQEAFPLSFDDAVLQRTPLGFDPSVWETFGPLTAGARVVVPAAGHEGDAARLVGLARDRGVTVLQATPSVLDALLEEPDLEGCTSLRHVFCGGEALSRDTVRRFYARLPAALHHLYGPTETTIDATCWTCRPDDDRPFVPIGRPIANARVRVLDDRLRPAPTGAAGEIYIGGAGLARGYLGRAEESAERFVPDPLGDEPKARLYRSGDVGRCLPDGAIEFLGRVDRQVKVRGMRVEPGEVEATLRAHPAVREPAVVARGGDLGAAALVAFVEAHGTPTEDELQRYLAERLPAPMVPAWVRIVDALPRTANEKLDRARLVAWAGEAPRRPEGRLAPRDAVELRLLEVWRTFFPDREVGVTDDFFELGGHSLLAMRLIARVREAFDRDVAVGSLIEGRTIAQQACLLRGSSAARKAPVALQPRGEKAPFFCVHPASGNAFAYLELATALGEARPFYGLEAVDPTAEAADGGIDAMAGRYLAELRHVQPQGPYLLGGWSMGGMIAFEMARQLERAGDSVARLVVMDARVPGTGPDGESNALFRAYLRDLGAPEAGLEELELDVDPAQTPARVWAWARRWEVVPPDMEQVTFEARLRRFDHYLGAVQAYAPEPIDGALTLFEAAEPLDAAASDGRCWEDLARGGVTRETVPGNHYTMLRSPNVEVVARRLRMHLGLDEVVAS